jgi:hypothetical protein
MILFNTSWRPLRLEAMKRYWYLIGFLKVARIQDQVEDGKRKVTCIGSVPIAGQEPTKAYLGFICEGFGRGSPQEIIAFSAKDALTVDFAPIEIY